ncbi:unnamed protein product [Lactuca saligna]|uniref:non-specific serine/threonine protein kinase n=1 Tax=Lactuca saligna TaxID=75948 RepID=A0AA35V1W0_LACSI|nr:unnamed protein product [Lactuca saligna]
MSSSGLNLEKYRIPLAEIIRATDNFSSKTLIGDGGFGMVHKGQLSELWQNPTVAIKRLDRNGYQGNNEFLNELEMVSSFHHPNIIPFIGYCDDGNEMIIVYEYAVHGSLDRHLQDPYKRRLITWTQRLKICLGVAKGLKYLHSGVGEHKRVIHRDMKSANILLDDNLEAKICDFGLSRFGPRNQPVTQLVTKASGTRFYMDPIYNERGILRKESDIYSLGVVLFEMSSGTLAYQGRCFGDDAKPQYLVNLVRCYYDDDRLDDEVDDGLDKLIDPYIKDHIEMSSFNMFNEIAHQCINIKLKERPTMDRVIEGIEEALNIQERNPILTECVLKDKIFYQGKHVAGFTIYKWLHRWKSFEAETTSVFEQLIKIIDVAIKDCTSEYTIYLSSNVLTLLFLIQGCLKFNDSSLEGFGVSPSRVSFVKFASELEEAQQIEAKYPTLLFKKQLTTYIEKMYGIICYNMKVELRSLVTICIDQAPQTATQVQIFAWSDDEDSQPSDQTNNWEAIVDFLNTLLNTLKENFNTQMSIESFAIQYPCHCH